jgi:hypothetical protein
LSAATTESAVPDAAIARGSGTVPIDRRARFLHENLDALAITSRTRELILAASPRGKVVRRSDGSPAIAVDELTLGAAPDERTHHAWRTRLGPIREGVILVFGVGTGHAVRELRERTGARLVVFEPDPGVLRTVLESGPSDLGGVPIFCDRHELKTVWPMLAGASAATQMVVTAGYAQAYEADVREVTDIVHMLVQDVTVVENTRHLRYREWIRHALENAKHLTSTSPFLALAGAYANVPAFIIGAGPSLQKNAALIAEASKKGIVFCVDVAGRVLAAHGAEPQVLCCLEGLNLSHHMKALPWIDRVVRAFSMSANPASLALEGGPLLPFFETIPAFAALSQLTKVRPVVVGGSVSTVAFSMAQQIGCSPIVLVGQDLAYTNGQTHAKGSALDASRVDVDPRSGRVTIAWSDEVRRIRQGSELGAAPESEVLFETEAWGGEGRVASTPTFNAYRLWFEVMADALRSSGNVRLVNATEGGSRIRGFEERTLRSVLDELPELGITSAKMIAEARERRPPVPAAELRDWAREQARLARAAGKLASRLDDAARQTRKKLDPKNPRAVRERFDQLADLENELREACKRQPMLEAWAYADLQNAQKAHSRPTGEDMKDDAAWSLETEARVARTIARAARELAAACEETAGNVC